MSFTLRQLTLALALCGLANSTFASDRFEPMRVAASSNAIRVGRGLAMFNA